jgi:hypothetical protein
MSSSSPQANSGSGNDFVESVQTWKVLDQDAVNAAVQAANGAAPITEPSDDEREEDDDGAGADDVLEDDGSLNVAQSTEARPLQKGISKYWCLLHPMEFSVAIEALGKGFKLVKTFDAKLKTYLYYVIEETHEKVVAKVIYSQESIAWSWPRSMANRALSSLCKLRTERRGVVVAHSTIVLFPRYAPAADYVKTGDYLDAALR